MNNYSLHGSSLKKLFGRRLIFEKLDFSYNEKGIFGISGINGAGKSTLVKIIAGIISPTSGKITHKINDVEIKTENLHDYIGLVSPYLVLYDEFTSYENLKFFSDIRGIKFDKEKVDCLLDKFLIYNRRDDFVKTYSSGMKQRLKYVFALMHSPALLLLDEPTSNLDSEGKNTVYEIVEEEKNNRIVIIASNEDTDLSYCSSIIYLNEYKR